MHTAKLFITLIQTQFSTTTKSTQIDWGGEFRPQTNILINMGIIHRLTCPRTSHKKGSVERKHGQIVEIGLTLLSHAFIPLKNLGS